MSLDVFIKYKEPKMVNYNATHTACGSTMALVPDDYKSLEKEWRASVTGNMYLMASHIPVSYKHKDGEEYDNNLGEVLWSPEKYGIRETDTLSRALATGISYMVQHREELLQYNPENGWGDYDSFLMWLVVYKKACDENPGCEVSVWR